MNLSAHWHYIEDIARRRLKHNKTEKHVSRYDNQIEVLGAAGELAALLGVPGPGEKLFVGAVQGRTALCTVGLIPFTCFGTETEISR